MDLEARFVERAREIGAAFGLASMDYRTGYAEELPFEDDSFDLATSQTTLIQVEDPALVLSEMRRVLKPRAG